MATRKEPAISKYTVIRDCAVGAAGDTVALDDDTAALLIRDGMVKAQED